MKLEEFLDEAKDDVRRFKAHWEKGREEHGEEVFPSELPAGEWFEQFISFLSSDEGSR